jgi:hypothetical protein
VAEPTLGHHGGGTLLGGWSGHHMAAKNNKNKKEKLRITLSNYHIIVNVPPKLPIVSISSLKLQENVNVPLMTEMPFIKLLK